MSTIDEPAKVSIAWASAPGNAGWNEVRCMEGSLHLDGPGMAQLLDGHDIFIDPHQSGHTARADTGEVSGTGVAIRAWRAHSEVSFAGMEGLIHPEALDRLAASKAPKSGRCLMAAVRAVVHVVARAAAAGRSLTGRLRAHDEGGIAAEICIEGNEICVWDAANLGRVCLPPIARDREEARGEFVTQAAAAMAAMLSAMSGTVLGGEAAAGLLRAAAEIFDARFPDRPANLRRVTMRVAGPLGGTEPARSCPKCLRPWDAIGGLIARSGTHAVAASVDADGTVDLPLRPGYTLHCAKCGEEPMEMGEIGTRAVFTYPGGGRDR